MAQDIRDQIDIAGLIVEVGGKGGAELVRADARLQRRSDFCVFLYKVLNGALRDSPSLQREEKRILVTFLGFDPDALVIIGRERFRNLRREIEHHLIAALARDQKGVFLKVDVGKVDADALADADPGAQEKHQHRKVARGCQFLVGLLMLRQRFAGLSLMQEALDLVRIQSEDGLFVNLGQFNQQRHIGRDPLVLKQVIVEGTDRAKFPLDGDLMVYKGSGLILLQVGLTDVIGQIFREGGQIRGCDGRQITVVVKHRFLVGEADAFRVQEREKRPEIHGVCQPREGSGGHGNAAQKIAASLGQFAANLSDRSNALLIDRFTVSVAYIRH